MMILLEAIVTLPTIYDQIYKYFIIEVEPIIKIIATKFLNSIFWTLDEKDS